MKRILVLFALLLLPLLAWGQGNTTTLTGAGAPSGGCAFIMRYIDSVGQVEYGCTPAGTWFQVGPGAAGAVSLSSTTDLTGNKAFTQGAFTLGFNVSANSGASNMFNFSDFATNTGTGYLFTVSTGSSSATKPFRVCYRGTTNCFNFDTTTLTTSGSAVIDATKLSGNLPALDGSALTNVNAITLLTKTWASPAAIGSGTPAAGTFAGLTGTGAVDFSGSTSSKVRVAAGLTTAANGSIGFDSTGNNLHAYNGADSLVGLLAASITPADNDCVKWTVAAGKYTLNTSGTGCGGGGGTGTVTVVGSGSLTSTAVVTGGGTTTLQTPSATTTLDPSGNFSTQGSYSSGVGGSVAGGYQMTQGTTNSPAANSIVLQAPTSVGTSYTVTLAGAAATGIPHYSNSTNVITETIAAISEGDFSFTNVTTANASVSKHGLLPILDGNASHCFLGDGTFGTCGSGGGNVSNTGTPTSGQAAEFTNATTIQGVAVTGTVAYVKSTTPTLVTPVLGVATATSINKVAITAPASSATLTIADGKTLTASNTLTLTGTDSSSVAFGGGGTVLYNGGALGTPSSITLTNGTGLPGAGIVSASVTATQLAAQYSKGSCTEAWGGSGTAFALTSGDDAVANNNCYNDSGVTRTITAVKCRSDNGSNTTTVNPTFGSAGTGTTILSGALTCGNSYAYSSTGTVSNASWTTGTGIRPAMSGTLTGTSIAMIVEFTF